MKKIISWVIFLSLINCGSLEGDKGKDGRDGKDATSLTVVMNLEEVPCSPENQNRVVFSEENNGWYQCKDKWLRLGLTLTDVAHQKLIGDWETQCHTTEEGESISAKLSFDDQLMYYSIRSFTNRNCNGNFKPRTGSVKYFLRSDSELDVPSFNFFTNINVTENRLLIFGLFALESSNVTASNRWSVSVVVLSKTSFPRDELNKPIMKDF